jgi:hypothetical protein
MGGDVAACARRGDCDAPFAAFLAQPSTGRAVRQRDDEGRSHAATLQRPAGSTQLTTSAQDT